MLTYKNIRIPKRGGGSRLQRVKVLASGKYKFVKNRKKGVSTVKRKVSRSRASTKSNRRKTRKMARSMNLPMGVLMGVGAGFVINQNSNSPLQNALNGDYENAVRRYIENMSGLDVKTGKWDPLRAKGALALLVGVGLHKLAGRFGVNQALGRAGVPLIRI